MVIRFIVGLLLVLGAFILILAINMGFGILLVYLHFPSFLITVLVPIVALLMAFPLKEMKNAFKQVFSKEKTGHDDYPQSIHLFTTMQVSVIIAGGIGCMMGLVMMLAKIEDVTAIAVGLSTALLTILYALVLNLVFIIPCKAVLRKKQISAG